MWDLPGGRINIGENIQAALKREIMEELGAEINVGSLIYSSQRIHTSEGSLHLFLYCEATLVNAEQSLKVPSEELAEVRWIDQTMINEITMYGDCMDAIKSYWEL
jgi:8-oxo-dGTP diphosphatase